MVTHITCVDIMSSVVGYCEHDNNP